MTVAAARTARQQHEGLQETWRVLCQFDPMVPPGLELPDVAGLLDAVAVALEHPQPLGWGLDPALDGVSETFAFAFERPEDSLATLVCLREAYARDVLPALSPDEQLEAVQRLNMIFGRLMVSVATARSHQLEEQALTDGLTDLRNRRAFDRDIAAELARARRSGRNVTVALIDLDGLKVINDRDGHAAGDRALRSLADALETRTRLGDRAYRVGGDEFALLIDCAVADCPDEAALYTRLRDAGAPAFSLGIASGCPDDPAALVRAADARLYASRRARRNERRVVVERGAGRSATSTRTA